MSEIKIYNSTGEIYSTLNLKEDVEYISGRVWKAEDYLYYYKGIGVPYNSHFIEPNQTINPYVYRLIKKSDVFYIGPEVSKICFRNKTGIFQERYQPQFTDYIGSCGNKELEMIENSYRFEKSSLELLRSNIIEFENNNQYYFRVNYRCGYKKFLESDDPLSRLYLDSLLAYMIRNNWNFVWDKNSISDISWNGLVTDVADIFYSDTLQSKLGTVYSVLYSLGKSNFPKYIDFINKFFLKHEHNMDYLLNSINMLDICGVDVDILRKDNPLETYKNAVLNYLVVGKNCGDCNLLSLGDEIRKTYIINAQRDLGVL